MIIERPSNKLTDHVAVVEPSQERARVDGASDEAERQCSFQ